MPEVVDVLTAAACAGLVGVFLARAVAGRGPRTVALGHAAVAGAMVAMAVASMLPHPVVAIGLPVAAGVCAVLAAYFATRAAVTGTAGAVRVESRRLVVGCATMAVLLLVHGHHGHGLDGLDGRVALLVDALGLLGVGYFVLRACDSGPAAATRSDTACRVVMNGLMAAMCLTVA